MLPTSKRTVLSDNALPTLVPIMEDIAEWSRPKIRQLGKRADGLAHADAKWLNGQVSPPLARERQQTSHLISADHGKSVCALQVNSENDLDQGAHRAPRLHNLPAGM